MDYRHELKYYLGKKDAYILTQRLSSALPRDAHCGDSGYAVASLYFDNMYLNAYYQKINGISERDKIRVRVYDDSKGLIRLEIKKKRESYVQKESAQISLEAYQSMVRGDTGFPPEWIDRKNPALNQYMAVANTGMLKPVVIVDYRRQVFVGPGDLRVSFDEGLRLAADSVDLFAANKGYLSVLPEDTVIMEVKYASFLPAYVDALLSGVRVQRASVSKYTLCVDKLKEVRHYAQY